MKILLKTEYFFLFLLGIFAFSQTGFSWWWFVGLFFLPDLSMLGYVINPKIGAYLYNAAHYLGTAVICFILGKYLNNAYLEVAGIIMFSHSAFDRILGYGLKFTDSFQNTHLGRIGKN